MDFTNQASKFIGLTEDQARDKAFQEGFAVRVVRRDGKSTIGTADFRLDRINLTISGGKVTAADVG